MEHVIKTGMIDGKFRTGRPREKTSEGMTQWLLSSRNAEEKGVGRNMIVPAAGQGTS